MPLFGNKEVSMLDEIFQRNTSTFVNIISLLIYSISFTNL